MQTIPRLTPRQFPTHDPGTKTPQEKRGNPGGAQERGALYHPGVTRRGSALLRRAARVRGEAVRSGGEGGGDRGHVPSPGRVGQRLGESNRVS